MRADRDPRTRLEAYARYCVLVRQQEAALDADDLEAFHALARERDDLQRRIPLLAAPDPLDPLDSRAMEEAIAGLEEARGRDGRIRRRLEALRDDARAGAWEADRRGGQLRRYVEGEGPDPGDRRGGLDVTL